MSTTASWKVATPVASGVLPDPLDLSKETDPAPVRGADASRRSPPSSSRPRRSSWAEGWPGRAARCSSRSARPWTATSAWSGGRGCCPPPCGMRRLPGRRPAGLGGARPWAGAIILTVAPNVALDITYRVDQLTAGLSHRVRSVEERAGGKGVNVARALHALGHDTFVLGLVGGATAGAITTDLARGGLGHELVLVEGPTRRSIAVVDARNQEATLFNEPGPRVAAPSWSDFEARLAARLPEATALVVSGSLPPGVGDDAGARLMRMAAAHRVVVLVDAVGEALLQAAAAGADIVKLNSGELRQTTGRSDVAARRPSWCRSARPGMTAFAPEGSWRAATPAPRRRQSHRVRRRRRGGDHRRSRRRRTMARPAARCRRAVGRGRAPTDGRECRPARLPQARPPGPRGGAPCP